MIIATIVYFIANSFLAGIYFERITDSDGLKHKIALGLTILITLFFGVLIQLGSFLISKLKL